MSDSGYYSDASGGSGLDTWQSGQYNPNSSGDWLQNFLKALGGMGGANLSGLSKLGQGTTDTLGPKYMPINYSPTGGAPRPGLLTQQALPGSAIPNFGGAIGQPQAGQVPGLLGGQGQQPQNSAGGGNPLSLLALLMGRGLGG